MTPEEHHSFDEILDYCLQEVAAGRMSLEDCLKLYPQVASALAPLLKIAARIEAVPRPPKLADEKVRAIGQQMLNRAVSSKRPVSHRPIIPRRKVWQSLAAVFLTLCALIIVGTGTVWASTASLPGDFLYPVKRLSEQVSLSAASPTDIAAIHVELAQRRLDEFAALAARGDVRPQLMAEVDNEIDTTLQATAQIPESQQQPVYEKVIQVADNQAALVGDTLNRVSPSIRARLETTMASISAKRDRAVQLIDTKRPLDKATAVPSFGDPTATSVKKQDSTEATTSITTTPVPEVSTEVTDTAMPPASQKTLPPSVKPTTRPPTHTPKPPVTPPGQVKTPKPTKEPPGQIKTPKPKK